MRIYLDVSCLNRPFDDASQERVALEAEAVAALLSPIDAGRITDVSSDMARIEINRTRDPDRRRKLVALLPPPARIIPLTDALLDAAERIVSDGFDLADAVHLAAAQQLSVDAFVTVDDALLKRTVRLRRRISVRVVNPIDLIEELGNETDR